MSHTKTHFNPTRHIFDEDRLIQSAKRAARLLRETLARRSEGADSTMGIKAAQSLEIISEICGHKNWNTYRAYLGNKQQELSGKLDARLQQDLCLDTGDVDRVVRAISSTIPAPFEYEGGDMWSHRMVSMLNAAVSLVLLREKATKAPATARSIQTSLVLEDGAGWEAVEPDDPMFLLQLYNWGRHDDLNSKEVHAARAYLDTLPGFAAERALRGECQSEQTLEQHGYLSMQVTKPLGDLVSYTDQIVFTAEEEPTSVQDSRDLAARLRVALRTRDIHVGDAEALDILLETYSTDKPSSFVPFDWN